MSAQVLYGAEDCGQAADIWAAGVSLYVLVTGGEPEPHTSPPPPPPPYLSPLLSAVALQVTAQDSTGIGCVASKSFPAKTATTYVV